MLDLAPYLQRAVLEIALLAVPAGLLGSWIVLRRLAFFTHAVGTVSFPALVLAGAWGIAPQLAALAAALGFGAAQERVARGGRLAADAATGLILVGALALGVVLASDVFESGAQVDTLLFGSLIGLTDRDLWLTAAVAVVAVVLDAGLRRHWLAGGFEPGSARALGLRPVLADRLLLMGVGAAAIVALDAVGALLVTVVLVVPAATVRLAHRPAGRAAGRRDRPGPRRGRRRGLARGRAERRRRARARRDRRRGLRARRRRDGGARTGGRRMSGLAVHGLAGGYVPGREVLRDVDFVAEPGQIVGVLGPNGGGKTTLFRALLGELPVRRGTLVAARPAGVRAADRPGAARLPRQRLRRRADGRVRPDAVVPAGGARGPRRRRTPRSTASGSPTVPGRRSARSPAASASAC